jgi:nucleotide-binding universal stress UspA family protein
MSTVDNRTERPQKTQARAPLVVGADVRGRSTSAVVWAAEEAQRTGTLLVLVTAHHAAPRRDGEHGLEALARRLTLSEVAVRDVVGSPTDALLATAEEEAAALLVLGRRSLGAAQRVLTESTSDAVTGRSTVPVVVVPETWIQPSMSSAPIVVGVGSPDLATGELAGPERDDAVLAFAFDRADDMRVALIVVSAWEMPTLYTWSPADVTAWRRRYIATLDERLAPWCRRYPHVEVVARSLPEPAHLVLLDAGEVAQLTVVGRHPGSHLGGSSIGSTVRHLLHSTDRPVAVVPVPRDATPRTTESAHRVTKAPAWARRS